MVRPISRIDDEVGVTTDACSTSVGAEVVVHVLSLTEVVCALRSAMLIELEAGGLV